LERVSSGILRKTEAVRSLEMYFFLYSFIQCCGSGSGIRCLFDPWSWIQNPGGVENPDPGPGSGIDYPDHISESLKNCFLFKILKFFDADPGWKKFGSGIRVEKNSDPG
jgi:hypothetical protein